MDQLKATSRFYQVVEVKSANHCLIAESNDGSGDNFTLKLDGLKIGSLRCYANGAALVNLDGGKPATLFDTAQHALDFLAEQLL